jgi:hypothetical protein
MTVSPFRSQPPFRLAVTEIGSGDNTSLLPPYDEGLADWCFFGDPNGRGHLSRSVFNYAVFGAGLPVVLGSPAVSKNCLALNGATDTVQSQFVPGATWSMIVAVADAAPSVVNMHAGGTFFGQVSGGPASAGVVMALNPPSGTTSGPRALQVAGTTSSGSIVVATAATSVPVDGAFRLLGLVVGPSAITATDLTDGGTVTVTPPSGSAFVPSGLPLEYATIPADRVASSFASAPHQVSLAFACAWAVPLAQLDFDGMVPLIRQMLSGRGITV